MDNVTYDCTLAYGTARVSEAYIQFTIMHMSDHVFPVLSIKYPINEDGESTTPYKLTAGMKPSISDLCVLFCPCVVRKANSNVGIKTLNIRHQEQKGFRSIFIRIPQHQKGYLV